jgi:uncharacterized protein DUF5666
MSDDLGVERHREQPQGHPDLDTTAVRPALADDLLKPRTYDDADFLADEELLAVGQRNPSRLTRVLLALLVLGVGILLGVQLGLANGSSPRSGTGGTSQSGRSGPAGARPAGGSAVPRSTLGSPAPAARGEVSSIRAHTLVLADQGATQTVTFTDDTTVTKPYGRGALAAGDAVTVFGSRAADGSVNATSIVVR